MGGSTYSSTVHRDRVDTARATGKPLMDYTDDIAKGKAAAKVHDILDPKRPNTRGEIVRESLDSDTHPRSKPVAVIFDDTGSMGEVPALFVEKLGVLMQLLVKKGFLEHPHVLFGSINDATTGCPAPLQLGQFEAGNEMDEALTKIYLQNGGGGTINESYELALYFMARKTRLDCLDKRGEKGYLFLIGDETPYPFVRANEVKRFIGDNLQADIAVEDILAECRQRFEVFWIMPANTQHFRDREVLNRLTELFGQNFIKLERPDDACELIASTIGVTEGYDINDVASALKDVGADAGSVDRASKALVTYAGNKGLQKANVTGTVPAPAGSDDVGRL